MKNVAVLKISADLSVSEIHIIEDREKARQFILDDIRSEIEQMNDPEVDGSDPEKYFKDENVAELHVEDSLYDIDILWIIQEPIYHTGISFQAVQTINYR